MYCQVLMIREGATVDALPAMAIIAGQEWSTMDYATKFPYGVSIRFIEPKITGKMLKLHINLPKYWQISSIDMIMTKIIKERIF